MLTDVFIPGFNDAGTGVVVPLDAPLGSDQGGKSPQVCSALSTIGEGDLHVGSAFGEIWVGVDLLKHINCHSKAIVVCGELFWGLKVGIYTNLKPRCKPTRPPLSKSSFSPTLTLMFAGLRQPLQPPPVPLEVRRQPWKPRRSIFGPFG